ncbi:capsular polysaccharide biosynthesis protein [Terriglobus roseus DSM 18391]|uniref:protein-tyrosine-phosphatase n=1 Tax=Terriglobus roseus (strain DSM 18391 / NRRL B-41598 / KBS 63) TaxID=926566 RepID=I3ZFC9_TERRK|nr:CpsB/CapC family capsule biosynthesis tyrosine phosphatase [Terriglobus roseus]AFL87947.1 capsular polysaccharide biosynthesis protein [Terriglobus roseus DSM 18391]
MVDIHQHLLFGIDDGSKSLEQSVAMVQMAMEDGITHVVATPHANDRYSYDRARNEGLLQQIREALPPDVAAAMTLGLGCDFHLNFENTEDARVHKRRYTINEKEYLLIELPDIGISNRIDEILYNLRIGGMTPILTHPERNVTLQRTPGKLQEWVANGLLLQVTAGSVLGTFGHTAESLAWSLLKQNSVHFIATDAHDLERRTPTMSIARRSIAERLGEDTATRLCVTNPMAVFEGNPLPEQPVQDAEPDEPEDKPSLWKRIFSR